MPKRQQPLVSGYYYHVFNREPNRKVTFTSPDEYERAKITLWYYQFQHLPVCLSTLLNKMPDCDRKRITNELNIKDERKVDLLAYCLMPNHFHLLLRQKVDGGISKYVGDFQNSYTKYFNKKHNRRGGLLSQRFRAVLIKSHEQLLHLTRYIHLNPYASGGIKDFDELFCFPYSSIRSYLGTKEDELVNNKLIYDLFETGDGYCEFMKERGDYQKELSKIKKSLDLHEK
ncbi:transposase [Candidatus Woesebacteria bacterium]|nr:MAG: transposase [Candidatus Woesebacteria bacterium]